MCKQVSSTIEVSLQILEADEVMSVCSPHGPPKYCDDSHPIVKVEQKSTLGVFHTLCNKNSEIW